MSYRLELLREELCEVYGENEELKDDVKFLEQELKEAQEEAEYLQQELDDANEILNGIEDILLNELDDEVAHMLYNKIFNIK